MSPAKKKATRRKTAARQKAPAKKSGRKVPVKQAAKKKPAKKAAKKKPAEKPPKKTSARKAPATRSTPKSAPKSGRSMVARKKTASARSQPKRAEKPRAKKPQEARRLEPASPLGHKYTCYECGAKFYDLNRPEPVCPKCNANQLKAPKTPAGPKAVASGGRRQVRVMAPLLDDDDDEVVVPAASERGIAGLRLDPDSGGLDDEEDVSDEVDDELDEGLEEVDEDDETDR